MSVYLTAPNLARGQQARFDKMALGQKEVFEELVFQGRTDHFSFTSGSLNERSLRDMGHPFARSGSAGRGIKDKAKQAKYAGAGVTSATGAFKEHTVAGSASNGAKVTGLAQRKGGGYYRKFARVKTGQVSAVTKSQVSKKGTVNPLPINVQSGELRRSFMQTKRGGKDLVVWMGFRSKHAKFVLSPTGTSKMIYRGFYSRSKNSTSVRDMGIIAQRHRARSAALVQSVRARQRKP